MLRTLHLHASAVCPGRAVAAVREIDARAEMEKAKFVPARGCLRLRLHCAQLQPPHLHLRSASRRTKKQGASAGCSSSAALWCC